MFRVTVCDPSKRDADSGLVTGVGSGAARPAVFYSVVTETDLPPYGGRPGAPQPRRFAASRRYSEFEAFHAALSAAAGRRLPPLPAKNIFAAFGGAQARACAFRAASRPSLRFHGLGFRGVRRWTRRTGAARAGARALRRAARCFVLGSGLGR
jgi:hypothetical protein